jgi:hypothetical protein
MSSGIICQACGIEAPTRQIKFHQNIGMLVMRRSRWINGKLCKRCIHANFWKMTATTLFLGPWGTISLVMAPAYILNNIVQYVGALGMSAVPADAKPPLLDQAAIARLKPHTKALTDRLKAKAPLTDVAPDIARLAGVTPGQVVKYVIFLSRPRNQVATGGVARRPVADLPPIDLAPEAPRDAALDVSPKRSDELGL